MKITVILDINREEEIVIYAHRRNEIIEQIETMFHQEHTDILGYAEGEVIKLDLKDIYYFVVENGKLYATTENEKYYVKTRLYAIEEKLGKNFIKINQSSIANMDKIQKFDVSIGGALKVIFKNGDSDYVSRRKIKSVKERFGL